MWFLSGMFWVCSEGMVLLHDETMEFVLNDLPGIGNKILIRNFSGKRVILKFLRRT